ncbi:MAG TPA: type II toxin-antitoxin system HicB family antitoxin [Chthoniobacteraceae bacterium]|nr:type II toxin-antitoxin system HicB family antitoxin [Chthoniobacteraceae bacterium]
MKKMNRYLTRIYWSDEDEAYMAEIPALPGCMSHGDTLAEAAANIEEAAELWLEMAEKYNDPIPEPDLAREEIERFAPVLSVAKLARRAGINQHTLASKLRRKSRFTNEEAAAILRALSQ